MMEAATVREMDRLEIEERLAKLQRDRLKDFDEHSLLWLALVPRWTESLARACDFPDGGGLLGKVGFAQDSLEAFLEQAEAAGICRRAPLRSDHDRTILLRARGLLHLLPECSSSVQEKTLEDTAKEIQRLGHPLLKAELFTDLPEGLPPEWKDSVLLEAVRSVRGLDVSVARARALVRLSAADDGSGRSALLAEALDTARQLTRPADRLTAMAEIAPRLPERDRSKLLEEAWEEARSLPSGETRSSLSLLLATPRAHDGDAEALSHLLAEIRHESVDRRRAAADALGKLGGDAAAQPLTTALDDEDELVRLISAGALGRLGAPEPLITALKSRDPRVRAEAAEGLGRTGEPRGASALVASLHDEDPGVRKKAVEALGLLRADSVGPAMEELLTDADPGVRLAAAGALLPSASELTERPGQSALEVVRDYPDEEARARVLASVVKASGRRDLLHEALAAALAVSDASLRCRILSELTPFLDRKAVTRAVEEALALEDEAARVETLVAMAPHLSPKWADQAVESVKAVGRERDFWMPDARRDETLGYLDDSSRIDLHEEAKEIGSRLLKARSQGRPVSPLLVRWSELTGRPPSGPKSSAALLSRQVTAALERRQTGLALDWVRSAEALARVFRGELEAAVLLGNRLVEMEFRRRQDERHLDHFLPRPDQEKVLDRLLDDDGPAWALHYLGMGGVGKTMLIRRITAQLAPRKGIPTSRIDFDYLSPDYPVRKPGQLLLELGVGLRGYSEAATHRFDELERRVLEMHEKLIDKPSSDNSLANVKNNQDFDRLLNAFVSLLKTFDGKVLLILDTCEELAKAYPTGTSFPSIEATFHVLKEIHKAYGRVRVVCAGRRPLAREGYDWGLDSVSKGEERLPAKQGFLRLHLIRGFDEEEATRYLDGRVPTISAAMQRAVFQRSHDTGRAARIRWEPADPGGGPSPSDAGTDDSEVRRYNPFDLTLYSEWLADDPKLDLRVIASGETDPYVERRILARIKQKAVRDLLPAVTLLGRFDQEMLRPALDDGDAVFGEAFRQLGDQEWVEYQVDDILKTSFLEVDRGLLPRLRDYYRHPSRSSELDRAGTRLAQGLDALVRRRELGRLGVAHLNAALTLLPPPDAATLWDHVLLRIGSEADWNWTGNVTATLLGEEGAAGAPDSPLRAAIRAAQVAAQVHGDPDYDGFDAWARIDREAGRDPSGDRRRWLRRRAVAGKVSAGRAGDRPPDEEALSGLWRMIPKLPSIHTAKGKMESFRRHQLAASVGAALEVALDQVESGRDAALLPPPDVLEAFLSDLERPQTPPALASFARMLHARLLVRHQRLSEGQEILEEAIDALPGELGAESWQDWPQPASLVDRLRLELLRVSLPPAEKEGQDRLRSWLGEAAARLETIDAERLASRILELLLALAPVAAEELSKIGGRESYDPNRQPRCQAHRETPCLLTRLALGWLALGKAERALDLLTARIQEATTSARDPRTVREAERTELAVVRRMRLNRGFHLLQRLDESGALEDRLQVLALRALDGSARAREALKAPLLLYPAGPLHKGLHLEDLFRIDSEGIERENPLRLYGVRRMAELALEEGELESLRRPATSADLLDLAQGWFRSCADPAGAMIASLRAAISAYFAGEVEGARRRLLGPVRSSYEDLIAEHGLPPWQDLVGPLDAAVRAEADLPDLGEALAHPSWGGWLKRLVYLRIALGLHSLELIERASAVQRILPNLKPWGTWWNRPNEDRGDRLTLEVDLFRDLSGSEKSVSEPASEESQPSRQPWPRRIFNAIATALGCTFGLCVLGAFAYGAYVLFGYAISWLKPGGISVWLQVPLFLLSLWLGGASIIWIRSKLRSLSKVELEVAPADASPSQPFEPYRQVQFQMVLRQRSVRVKPGPLFLGWRPEEVTQATGHTPGLVPYASTADALPDRIVAPLAQGTQHLASHFLTARLRIDPSLAAFPWEAWLHVAIDPQGANRRSPKIQLYRSAGISRQSPLPLERAVVAGWANPTWRRLLTRIWRPLRVELHRSGEANSEAEGLVHLIGNPIRTSSGLYLDLGEDAGPSRQGTDPAPRRGTHLVAPDSLRHNALVVLQAEPLPEGTGSERLETELEQSADLRLFAEGLLAGSGVSSVLVVPALRAAEAETLLRAFVRGLRTWRTGSPWPRWDVHRLDRLVQATLRARRALVRRHVQPASRERALDVTLHHV